MGMEGFRRHGKKLLGVGAAAALGGLLANEVTKPPKLPRDEITTTADTIDSGKAKPKSGERTIRRTGEYSDQVQSGDHLSRPVTEETVPDFSQWNFRNSDLTDLTRVYQPARGYEEVGWNPNGSYDAMLHAKLADNQILDDEYKDIVSHLKIEAGSDWLSVTSGEDYGALDLGYQVLPPTEDNASWRIAEYVNDTWVANYGATMTYETEQDIKDQVLRHIKNRILTSAQNNLQP